MRNDQVRLSKFLSLVLRHKPETIGIKLDSEGWVDVSDLLKAINSHGLSVTARQLEELVDSNDKKRFSFSEDLQRIRASQGHSVEVELGYEPVEPPHSLYHGTIARALDSILAEGLRRGRRHDVHLSADVHTAKKVGSRRGKPVILQVDSGRMYREGHQFYLSANGVWLTRHVPAKYIRLMPLTGEEQN